MNKNTIASKLFSVSVAALGFWIILFLFVLLKRTNVDEINNSVVYTLIFKVILNFMVAFWLYVDAKSRGWQKKNINTYLLLSILITEFIVPIYIVKSRGWKGAVKTSMRFLIYLLMFVLAVSLASYAMKQA